MNMYKNNTISEAGYRTTATATAIVEREKKGTQ